MEPDAKYELKDSGKREQFATGAVRDVQTDKPEFGLLPFRALERVAMQYKRGLKKYGRNNWRKGMPLSRVTESLLRHAIAWKEGDDGEDHLAAVVFNALAIMEYQRLYPDLDDMESYRNA